MKPSIPLRDSDTYGVDADVLAPTICYLMSHVPDRMDFTEVSVRITGTEDASARRAYIAGLGCVQDTIMRKT